MGGISFAKSKLEDRPTPPEVYNWRVYSLAMVACFAAVMIGYDAAFIGTSISLTSFKQEFGLDTKTASEFAFLSANIVSCYPPDASSPEAGCFFGSFLGYPAGYYLGRKWGLFASAMVFNVGAILQCVASKDTGLGIMYAGRIIVGLGVGAASNLTPMYVAEIAPPVIRGRLMGLYEAGWQTGGVTGFWINYGITNTIAASKKQWLISFCVQLIPGGLLAIGAVFLVESPRWLASRDRGESALHSLAMIRNLSPDHPYVVEEMEEINDVLERDRLAGGAGFWGPWKALFTSRSYVKRAAIAVTLFMWQNGTGINAINYYSPVVFKSIGITGLNTSLFTTGIFGLIKFVGSCIWLMFIVDRFGRRALLLVGSAGGAVCMYYVGAYIAIADPANHPTANLSQGGISAMAFFYLWTCFYTPSWNGTPWIYGAEVFPTYIRPATQAFVAAANWLWAFIIARFTPQMFLAMGYGVYMMFASLMVLSIPYVYFFIPETRQVPLERMNELFEHGLAAPRAHGVVMSKMAVQPADLNQGRADSELGEVGEKDVGTFSHHQTLGARLDEEEKRSE